MARQGYHFYNWPNLNPIEGMADGKGFTITWRNSKRIEHNVGADVGHVVLAAQRRIEYYQSGKFACDENAAAIESLKKVHEVIGNTPVIYDNHFDDANGNPAGGVSSFPGGTISWQRGPLVVDGERQEPNGAYVEDIIDLCEQRAAYLISQMNSVDDAAHFSQIVDHLGEALRVLDSRTKRRVLAGTEGTHAGN